MTMENPPFEDVFHIEHGNFPACHVSFQGRKNLQIFGAFFQVDHFGSSPDLRTMNILEENGPGLMNMFQIGFSMFCFIGNMVDTKKDVQSQQKYHLVLELKGFVQNKLEWLY